MSCDDGVCGTGGWGGPKPGDPSNNSVLSATPAFGGIDLNWSFPTLNPFAVAHTRIFRAIIDDVNAALVLVDPAGGSFYYDKVPPNIEYFYWIQFVSINGTQGELIGPASAAARDSIENTIEQLTGKIDAGMLAQALKTQIALIPEIDAKIFDEIENRLAGNLALSNAIAQVQDVSDETKTYVLEEIAQRQTADTAIINSINTLFAQAAGNAAAISEEQTIRVTKDDALATRIDSLAASVGPNIAAALVTEQTVRAAADSALASDITTLFTNVNANAAAIVNEATTRSNATSAQATQINDLYAKVAIVNGATTTAIQAAISTEQTARANADGALASDITTLYTRSNTATAAIQSNAQAIIDQGVSTTSQINVMRSTVAGDTATTVNGAIATEVANRNSAISSAVQSEASTRASQDGVLATAITQAEARANDQTAQAETRMTTSIGITNGKVTSIGALYTAKVTVNGLIGGFGVYNDGTEVQAGFDVDTFWIGRTAANKRKPFIVVGSEVFIDQAVINQLTFSKLRADDGSVIVANGKLSAAYINARLLNVTSDGGVVGLNVDSAGNVTFGGTLNVKSATSGARTEIDNNGMRVYAASGGYANTGLKVRIGIW